VICRFCQRAVNGTGAPTTPEPTPEPLPQLSTKSKRSPFQTFLTALLIVFLICAGLIALIAVVAFFASPGGTLSTARSGSSEPASKWKDATGATSEAGVFAADIVAAYKANEIAADARFKDRTIAVTGPVDSIGKDVLDTPYVTLSGEPSDTFRRVQAGFSRDAQDELARLQKGQVITVVCRGRGLMMNVQLDRCAIR
jgi:hypothetical protein